MYCPYQGMTTYYGVDAGYYSTGCTGDNYCTGESQCTAGNYCSGGISYGCPSGQTSGAGATACHSTTCTVYCGATNIGGNGYNYDYNKGCSTSVPSGGTIYGTFTCSQGIITAINSCYYSDCGTYTSNKGYNWASGGYSCSIDKTYGSCLYNYSDSGSSSGQRASGYIGFSCSC